MVGDVGQLLVDQHLGLETPLERDKARLGHDLLDILAVVVR